MAHSKNIDGVLLCCFFFLTHNENFQVSVNSVFVSVFCLKKYIIQGFIKLPQCLYSVYVEV